jgi:threonine synthase
LKYKAEGTALSQVYACRYTGDEIPEADLRNLMQRSYVSFADHKDPVPTKKVGDLQIMELFHGPTFAFKDVALQALGNLFEYFLKRKQKRITVVGATSGDTGSAAIYGLRGKENVECFILFPEGRVSPIQQLQMTSVSDENVHCIAVQVSGPASLSGPCLGNRATRGRVRRLAVIAL